MRDNQYGVGLRFFNANVCKRRKTLQQEEPAVLGAINKKSVSKLINGIPLTFVLVYRDGAMFARSIGEYVIIFNKNQGIVAVYRSL